MLFTLKYFKVSFILIVFSQLQKKSTCYKLCDHMIDIQYIIYFFQCLKLWPIPIGNIDITPKDPKSLLFIIQHRNNSNPQDIFKLTVWCIHFDGTNILTAPLLDKGSKSAHNKTFVTLSAAASFLWLWENKIWWTRLDNRDKYFISNLTSLKIKIKSGAF